MTNNPLVIAVDFDGTLCECKWPEIGEPIHAIVDWCKQMRAEGNKLILNTCREGELLDQAAMWCLGHGLLFDAYNTNLPGRIEQYGGDCRKISADFYLDDKNLLIREVM